MTSLWGSGHKVQMTYSCLVVYRQNYSEILSWRCWTTNFCLFFAGDFLSGSSPGPHLNGSSSSPSCPIVWWVPQTVSFSLHQVMSSMEMLGHIFGKIGKSLVFRSITRWWVWTAGSPTRTRQFFHCSLRNWNLSLWVRTRSIQTTSFGNKSAWHTSKLHCNCIFTLCYKSQWKIS